MQSYPLFSTIHYTHYIVGGTNFGILSSLVPRLLKTNNNNNNKKKQQKYDTDVYIAFILEHTWIMHDPQNARLTHRLVQRKLQQEEAHYLVESQQP